jgi:hypothetical protein
MGSTHGEQEWVSGFNERTYLLQQKRRRLIPHAVDRPQQGAWSLVVEDDDHGGGGERVDVKHFLEAFGLTKVLEVPVQGKTVAHEQVEGVVFIPLVFLLFLLRRQLLCKKVLKKLIVFFNCLQLCFGRLKGLETQLLSYPREAVRLVSSGIQEMGPEKQSEQKDGKDGCSDGGDGGEVSLARPPLLLLGIVVVHKGEEGASGVHSRLNPGSGFDGIHNVGFSSWNDIPDTKHSCLSRLLPSPQ